MFYLFDIESTGLLRRNSQIHCIVLRDLLNVDAEPLVFDTIQDNVAEGVEALENADGLAGHNIVSYDIPLLRELFPSFKIPKTIHDTLILSRLYYPNLSEVDYQRPPRGLPKKLFGSHGLEAWGHRIGEFKGTFGKQNDWSTYSKSMLEYCLQDVNVNVKLYQKLAKRLPKADRLSPNSLTT